MKQPTLKQAKAIKHIIEDGDAVSVAMAKAGYAPSVSKNPMQLTKSKSFIEVLEKAGITDVRLAQVLREGLEATKLEGNTRVKDFGIVHKYMETGLKLKGHSKETPTNNTVIIPIYGGLSTTDNTVQGHNSNQESILTQE